MNLLDLEEVDVAEFNLLKPDGEPTDIVFLLAGPAHPARMQFEKKQGRAVMREFNKKGKASLPEDPDELYDRETLRLATLTVGWTNLKIGDDAPAYSSDTAAKLFANRKLQWVRDAVGKALGDHEVFMPGSQPT